MSYEYMQGLGSSGMGTTRDDARAAYNSGNQAYEQRNYAAAYDYFRQANQLMPSVQAQAAMGSSAAAQNQCAQAILHFREAIAGGYTLSRDAQAQYDRCLESKRSVPVTTPKTTQPATTEKETWYPESMEAVDTMFTNLFNKLGIGDQSAAEAEDAARAEAAAATAGTSAAAPAPPPAETTPRTVPPTPWYQEYAPHMVIGGLGLGAAVVLVLAMRKKKEPAPW